ncbi:MAG: flagellar biosynthesis protein FlhA [Candidatus Melainabacteria bacterium]|nr:MAG: flagellar biosynthesis protein FlhA [Candidatus Melainabacteria bacterium]RAI13670.1 MAG: flagellar biosynthesis protein FlhA [Candidatus Melainabacteria bacterium]
MNFGKLSNLLKNNDISLAIGLVFIVLMMVIPLPPAMLDILLTINISLSVIILLVCLYTKEPLDYSSFPTVLLIATLFRLGLNISSTRLILLYGEAGNVIHSFGEFVVGGNYVVGFVIFVILVLINFMVITGGATRVAEVTARFTLDKMPGKQLSIDADLNAGLISDEEAKARRKALERETDFYGTMDGASKFVKGDATAGILITIINIIGGLIIGMVMLKMDFSTALTTYTILTVGDGLVSQVPALLISVATGLIVSRATGKDESLSQDIGKEMFSDPRVLGVVSGLLLVLGIIPGMPTIPFLLISIGLGSWATLKHKEKQAKIAAEAQAKIEAEKAEKLGKRNKRATRESVMELLNVDTIEIEVGYRLVPLLQVEMGGDLLERIAQIRRQTALDMGIVLPSIRVRDNLQLSPNTYQIKLKGVPIEAGEVYPDRSLAMNAMGGDDNPNIKGISAVEPAFGLPALWIEEDQKDLAEAYGYTVVSPSAVVSTHLTEVIKKNAADILTRSDVQQLVDNLRKEVSDSYVDDLLKDMTIGDIQQILQSLLRERVTIRDLKTILETISLQSKFSKDYSYLTEQVRHALARSICKQNVADNGELMAIILSPDVERTLAQGMSPDGRSLTVDPTYSKLLFNSLDSEIQKAITTYGCQPVILCSAAIRLAFRNLIENYYPQFTIMSYNEISSNTKTKSVGIVKVVRN